MLVYQRVIFDGDLVITFFFLVMIFDGDYLIIFDGDLIS